MDSREDVRDNLFVITKEDVEVSGIYSNSLCITMDFLDLETYLTAMTRLIKKKFGVHVHVCYPPI